MGSDTGMDSIGLSEIIPPTEMLVGRGRDSPTVFVLARTMV